LFGPSREPIDAETKTKCLHAMTGAIVLYDHSVPMGAFYKSSIQVQFLSFCSIIYCIIWMQIKKCCKTLSTEDEEQLKAVVKYNSLNFKQGTTPLAVRNTLA
jgi:hypothetical protein